MSMYGMMFGESIDAPGLLELLTARQPFSPGRFRDAWVEAEGFRPLIRVHTRNGGGNRECYCADEHYCNQDAIESMQDHPWYVRDADDDYDSTYADFWFAPDPTEIARDDYIRLVEIAVPPVDMTERWTAVIEAIKTLPHDG